MNMPVYFDDVMDLLRHLNAIAENHALEYNSSHVDEPAVLINITVVQKLDGGILRVLTSTTNSPDTHNRPYAPYGFYGEDPS